MGAFFLFNSSESVDTEAVQRVFDEKGFSLPRKFTVRNLTLWLYKKQLVDEDNYVFSKEGSALFATGTLVYKGKTYRQSLKCLLEDFENNKVVYDEIIGAFCVIFYKDQEICILTDRANIYHIFTHKIQTILSSSFLALIASQKKKLSLNRLACLEHFMIGYVVGPETSIKDIFLVNDLYRNKANSLVFSYLSWPETNTEESFLHNFKDCVNRQLEVLANYYRHIGSLSTQYGVDIGLSGGYDSRLNLLLSDMLPVKPSTHTHFSEEHRSEIKIAKLLAKEMGNSFRGLPISDPEVKTEKEIIDNLSDSLYFYDGRTNETMGTYNDVHTRKYRIGILDQNRLGLNGLGGELYRNYDYVYYNKLNFVEWIKYHVMDPYRAASFNDSNDFKKLIGYVAKKYIEILGIRHTKYISKVATRRFYAEIWLPYSAGIKNLAENQLAFFLMPFTDYHISHEALKATPHIGMTGKFEATMMMELNKKVAGIPSNYGFGFDREPLSYLVKSCVRCYLPDRIKNILGFLKINICKQNKKDYITHLKRHEIIRQIMDVLLDTKLPINWDNLFEHKAHFERSIFIGYFLYKFSDKISLEN